MSTVIHYLPTANDTPLPRKPNHGRLPKGIARLSTYRRQRIADAMAAAREAEAPRKRDEQIFKPLIDIIARRSRESRIAERRCFVRWQGGNRSVRLERARRDFIEKTEAGIASDSFGQAGEMFRWAASAVPGDEVIHSVDDAIALAVVQLNDILMLARYGGLRNPFQRDKGGPAYDFAEFVEANFGRAMARLQRFGAMTGPDAEEAAVLARRKAEFDSAGGLVGSMSRSMRQPLNRDDSELLNDNPDGAA